MNKVIKTPEDYASTLARLHALLDTDPVEGSHVADEIELLALLLAAYEKENFQKLPLPTPVDAIRFRMDQMNLAQKDLVKYLGSRSRVSEVLAGKRELTLSMVRALHDGLGIPAEVLIKKRIARADRSEEIDVSKLPVREMLRRRWFEVVDGSDATQLQEAVATYIQPVLPYAAAFKRTIHFRGDRSADTYALTAWLARVWHTATAMLHEAPEFDATNLNKEIMRDVVKLSCLDNGPPAAVEFLRRIGVCVVIEPALPRTFLDGATLFVWERPVIGLTMRFDRLDNFWFVLLHELAHVVLHRETANLFLDDLESEPVDAAEREADELALNSEIPAEAWRRSPASKVRSRQAAEHLARQLRISPAIVAGRIRRRYDDYTVLQDVIGQGQVRQLFPNTQWKNDDEATGNS